MRNNISLKIDRVGASMNQNVYLLVGEPGSGKGYFLKSIIPELSKNGNTIFIIDPECEYENFAGMEGVNVFGIDRLTSKFLGSKIISIDHNDVFGNILNEPSEERFIETFEHICNAVQNINANKLHVIIEELHFLFNQEELIRMALARNCIINIISRSVENGK